MWKECGFPDICAKIEKNIINFFWLEMEKIQFRFWVVEDIELIEKLFLYGKAKILSNFQMWLTFSLEYEKFVL